jgi:hypothetical protein
LGFEAEFARFFAGGAAGLFARAEDFFAAALFAEGFAGLAFLFCLVWSARTMVRALTAFAILLGFGRTPT